MFRLLPNYQRLQEYIECSICQEEISDNEEEDTFYRCKACTLHIHIICYNKLPYNNNYRNNCMICTENNWVDIGLPSNNPTLITNPTLINPTLINPTLTNSNLTNIGILTRIKLLELFPDLLNITIINLDNRGITYINSDTFANLPNLQILNLYNNQIVTIESNTFANLPNLQILNLYNNQIVTIESDTFSSVSGKVELFEL